MTGAEATPRSMRSAILSPESKLNTACSRVYSYFPGNTPLLAIEKTTRQKWCVAREHQLYTQGKYIYISIPDLRLREVGGGGRALQQPPKSIT